MPKAKEKEKMIRRTYTFPESVVKQLEEVAEAQFDCNNSLALRTAIRDLYTSYKRRKHREEAEAAINV